MEFFSRENNQNPDIKINQSITNFINNNTQIDTASQSNETHKNSEINKLSNHKYSYKPSPYNKTLDTFQKAFKMALFKSKTNFKRHQNLTKAERSGLYQLKANNEIIIKKADKGYAVVVMNTTEYLREGYCHLLDKNFYQLQKEDPTPGL